MKLDETNIGQRLLELKKKDLTIPLTKKERLETYGLTLNLLLPQIGKILNQAQWETLYELLIDLTREFTNAKERKYLNNLIKKPIKPVLASKKTKGATK